MSVGEVKATITDGITAAEEACQLLGSIRDMLRATRELAAATTHDSSHEAVRRGLRTPDEANREGELTLRRLRASAAAASRYLELIG